MDLSRSPKFQRLSRDILFLNLTAFSKTGGIEKFNRCLLKALRELGVEGKGIQPRSLSLHDSQVDEQYFDDRAYKGFAGSKYRFVLQAVRAGLKADAVIIGHINLAIVGVALKTLRPNLPVILVTHGIEVWEKLSGAAGKMIHLADRILAVSSFTASKLQEAQGVPAKKIRIFHNTIDPYFPLPQSFSPSATLRERYGLKATDFVLYTFTRLSSKEQYKGYDTVLEALPALLKTHPQLRYMIAGRADEVEAARVKKLIDDLGLRDHVHLIGFVADDEITAHYQMADTFIMPSRGEGFGIVFIEAMACGLQVIAGNRDGSVDALKHGELGTLVDPTDVAAVRQGILQSLENYSEWTEASRKSLQQRTLAHFGFDHYKSRLASCLGEIAFN